MAYFYSEKGMRFFVLLLALLLGWLFMGLSRAAFSEHGQMSEEADRVAMKLCPQQIAEMDSSSGLLMVRAFAVHGE